MRCTEENIIAVTQTLLHHIHDERWGAIDEYSDLVGAVQQVVGWLEEIHRDEVPNHIPDSQVEKFLEKKGEKNEPS